MDNHRKGGRWLQMSSLWFATLFLAACGGGGSGDDNQGTDESVQVSAEQLPKVSRVESLSPRFVELTFEESAGQDLLEKAELFTFTLSNGNNAPVMNSYPAPDGRSVIFELDIASEDEQLVPNGTLTFDVAGLEDEPIIFTGNASEELTVLDVKPLSDTVTLIRFSEPVSANAGFLETYRIKSSDGATLAVQAATLGADSETVVLNTEPQADVRYTVEMPGVVSLINETPLYINGGPQTFVGLSRQSAVADPLSVVSAGSVDNTHVVVAFSKPVTDSALDPASYGIVQANVNTEAGFLQVVDVAFTSLDRTAVRLTTRSQNELTYQVSVVNVTDLYGQQIQVSPGTTVVLTANTAEFAGTPPGSLDLVDTDGDGLYDNEEQAGYTVIVELANGDIVTRQITSDPDNADTDGDGLNDSIELQYGMNPRATDTDGDGLDDNFELNTVFSNPFAQDSDQDGLPDGFEHFDLKTSPLLADTDGDQLSDNAELFELNRDPLIADLPELRIDVGNVRLQIDERYSFTDENGEVISQESSSNTTLATAESTAFTRSNSDTTEWGVEASLRAGIGTGTFFGADKQALGGGAELTVTGGYSASNTKGTEAESARESQEVYENSLTKGAELSTTNTVNREVIGARIDVDLSILNTGNVPFNVSDIEITVLQQVGARNNFLPVATLVSNSELITGTPLNVSLGAFNAERGPFLFASREVFPNLVEDIMRKPAGLVFRVANYRVTDELGRTYTFINQVARDRTARITLDFGDADAAEDYLVATSGVLDDGGVAGGGYLGGFASNGDPIGLPVGYVLSEIMGIPRHDTSLDYIAPGVNGVLDTSSLVALGGDDRVAEIDGDTVITAGPNGWLDTRPAGDDFITNPDIANGIVAGLNKRADSLAEGDDVQLVPRGTTGLSLGTLVIGPGANGRLDTGRFDDDAVEFFSGYETSRTCSVTSNKPGNICRVDSDCACAVDDSDLRCLVPAAEPVNACSGPEQLVRINTLRDGDFNRGWVVLSADNLPAAADFNEILVEAGNDLFLAFLQDLDGDGLFARNELLSGSTDSSADNYVNTSFGESFDPDLASGCTLPAPFCDGIPDSRDTDRDGLGDFAEINVGWRVAVDGGNLRQTFSSPRFRDTDGDGLLDPVEQDLRRYCELNDSRTDALCAFLQRDAVGIDQAIGIIAGRNGIAESEASETDEQLVPLGTEVAYGTAVVGPGEDNILSTSLAGDDLYESINSIPPATDPTQRDTDRDGVSDFTELDGFEAGLAIVDGGASIVTGSPSISGNGNVESVKNGDDIQRALIGSPITPGGVIILPGPNGVIDSVPNQGFPSIPLIDVVDGLAVTTGYLFDDGIRPATPGLVSDPLRRDTDSDTFADGQELRIGLNPTEFDGSDFIDSDLDGLTDREEDSLGWMVSVNGAAGYPVKSSPSLPDTDFDGLPDVIERDLRTDPNRQDTDNDGLSDFEEVNDLRKYSELAQLYPVLDFPSSTGGLGTNPLLSDTDNDDLSDKDEQDGFLRLIPGRSTPETFFTNPLLADTDLDGVNDGDEVNRRGALNPMPTDPTDPDTDGDNRNDLQEETANTDPFVPDAAVILRYTYLQLDGGADNEFDWTFRAQGPSERYPGDIVVNTREFAQNNPSFDLVEEAFCEFIRLANFATLAFNGSYAEERFVMKAGDAIVLSGEVREINGQGGFCPTAAVTVVDELATFEKVLTYEDIVGSVAGRTGTITTVQRVGAATPSVGWQVVVE
ncbi:hypothetical protein [Marinobacter confluentis]|uniref:SbsA Ig-like domain-containing protein n=1 Tax=Marinobacter confluentis TaxID=1697557 RepID=A0A4Z1C3E4_9GAMM|nr:hypothetical protein [Marinobacter confluentis]TGN39860.1 hypothetical protein E5Q11_06040 [Marinobacter confluentis]